MTAEAPTTSLREFAEHSHAWPFEEARKIVARLKRRPKDEVIFETGYGPSGLPHIGTFGEVARTSMVRHAFRVLTDDKIKTRLIAFSDDMDALRKVPDNVPHKEMLAQHLGKPLTKVPDPFGTHASFAEHNNARLRAFLDQFGFDYEFLSSTACYTSGRFDAALLKVLQRFDAVMNIMLPSLREERAQTYSPFLPIDPTTGIVLQVPVIAHDAKAGTITYENTETGERVTTLVTGGRCKLQWKPDWAMRWIALAVDYEMAGKDLIDSVKLSGEICRALGGLPPEGFNYELFLDENGQKISKSKGNGLTIEEWLRYASPESLSLFMYREPKAAKRLYFDVIPRHVDEYQQLLDAYQRQGPKERLSNPVWHIHGGAPPKADNPVSFAMLISLVTASNAENAETLWGFIGRYRPGVTPETHPHLAALVQYAIHYFRDFVLPAKKFRAPSAAERAALIDLRDALSQLPADATAEAIQDVIYEVGRREPFLDEKKKAKDGKPGVSLDWFNMLYQVLLGQEKGPRFGSFVAAYGIQNTIDMIDGALARSPALPKLVLDKGRVYRLARGPDAKTGEWYVVVSCRRCSKPIYLLDNPHKGIDPHRFIGEGKISTPCPRCGHDDFYLASEVTSIKATEDYARKRTPRVEPSKMPRQKISKKYPKVIPTFGPGFLEDRPKAAALVARCIALWTEVETNEARLLATMLRANTEPAIALFLAIQNSRLQFAVLDAVAKVVLSGAESGDYELFLGLMDYRAAVEKERNALAHGCFGGSDQIEEGVAWIDSVHLSQHTIRVNATGVTDDALAWLRDRTYVYELSDLERIARDIENLHTQIGFFAGYLISRQTNPPATDEWRAERYKELSAEPHVAQAIATRRENLKRRTQEPE